MKVRSLKISNFRNFELAETEVFSGVNIFHGSNGAGKTNLLEAIFVMCLGRSQKGATDIVMLRHDKDVYRLEGIVDTEEKSIEVAVAYQRNGRKKVTIDKVNGRLADLYDLFCIVSIGPEDSDIICGAPSARRTFLDIYLSQLSPRYLDSLTRYQKVLAQKNAALKNEMDCSPFDELMVQYGTEIIERRARFIKEINDLSKDFYNNIAGEHILTATYLPSIASGSEQFDETKIAEQFAAKIEASRHREEAMANSMIGPHRDDMLFAINGYPARQHGSQGEVRTAAIVLKLAVYTILKNTRNTEPLLLLDEVFAELDESRAAGLIESFEEYGQLFLTTALQPPQKLKASGRSYLIDDGKISEPV